MNIVYLNHWIKLGNILVVFYDDFIIKYYIFTFYFEIGLLFYTTYIYRIKTVSIRISLNIYRCNNLILLKK